MNPETLKEEIEQTFPRNFFRHWFKQHFNLCHSDPRFLNATDYDMMREFYEFREWEKRKRQSEEEVFKNKAAEGLACEECRSVFTTIPERGVCPVCRNNLKVPLDPETEQYLTEAGVPLDEF